MPRSVNDVDDVVIPHTGCGGRGDGDASLLFLFHPVHSCGAVMDFADFVVHSGVIEDAFGCGGLSGVDVGHDANISNAVKGMSAWHGESASVSLGQGFKVLQGQKLRML